MKSPDCTILQDTNATEARQLFGICTIEFMLRFDARFADTDWQGKHWKVYTQSCLPCLTGIVFPTDAPATRANNDTHTGTCHTKRAGLETDQLVRFGSASWYGGGDLLLVVLHNDDWIVFCVVALGFLLCHSYERSILPKQGEVDPQEYFAAWLRIAVTIPSHAFRTSHRQPWEKLCTSRPANAATRLVPNSGRYAGCTGEFVASVNGTFVYSCVTERKYISHGLS